VSDSSRPVNSGNSDVVELLQAAKNDLLDNGWWALGRIDLPGQRFLGNCTTNALHTRNGNYSCTLQAERFLLQASGFTRLDELRIWNDEEAAGINDVLDLYDEAILLAKEAS
jgi:hypothetical protein